MILDQENSAVASTAHDGGDYAMEKAEQGTGALASRDNNDDHHKNEEDIYNMMDNLQQHQRTNAALIGAVHEEQQRAYVLKKGILGLVLFAIVLSLSDMTTTLVAARLFQQKSVGVAQSQTSDLVDPTTHTRLGTTTKMVGFSMNHLPLSFLDSRTEGAVLTGDDHAARRRLQQAQSLVCSDTGDDSSNRACQIQGEMHFSDAVKLYQEFCPSWPDVGGCSDGGVVSSLLTCNGKHSQLYGGIRLPTGDPTLGTDENGNDYVLFPTAERGYEGIQQVLEPDGSTCSQSFHTGIFCFYDNSKPCYVFSSWEPGQCEGAVELCGNAPANAE